MLINQTILERAEQLAAMLQAGDKSLSMAESCTGGGLAAALTACAGSSAWFSGGVVAYNNDVKATLLGVPVEVLNEFGAVSEQTARAMAEGALATFGSDFSLSITGVAGPGGGSPAKPVGMVCFGLASAAGVLSSTEHFDGCRDEVRERSVLYAIDLLKNTV